MRPNTPYPILLFLLTWFLVGCGDVRAIEDRALVVAVGIGHGQKPGHIHWTFVVPNVTVTVSSISSLSPSNQTYSIETEAPNWAEALRRTQDQVSRDLYFGQLEVVAVDRGLTSDELTHILNALNQDGLIPKSFWLLTSSRSPATALTFPTAQEIIPRYYFNSYFRCRTCHAMDLGVFGWEWWNRRWTPGISPFLPLAESTKTGLRVREVVVYPSHGRPIQWDTDASEGLAYLTSRVTKSTLAGTVNGIPVVLERVTARSGHRARLRQGHVDVQAEVRVRAFLSAYRPGIDLKDLQRISDWAAAKILAKCQKAIAAANHSHTDPFGYTKDALAETPKLAERLQPGDLVWWPLRVHTRVEVLIDSAGTRR